MSPVCEKVGKPTFKSDFNLNKKSDIKMSERMKNFMSQCIEAMESENIKVLLEIVTEFHINDELRFIRAEDPEFYSDVIEMINK